MNKKLITFFAILCFAQPLFASEKYKSSEKEKNVITKTIETIYKPCERDEYYQTEGLKQVQNFLTMAVRSYDPIKMVSAFRKEYYNKHSSNECYPTDSHIAYSIRRIAYRNYGRLFYSDTDPIKEIVKDVKMLIPPSCSWSLKIVDEALKNRERKNKLPRGGIINQILKMGYAKHPKEKWKVNSAVETFFSDTSQLDKQVKKNASLLKEENNENEKN